MQQVLNNNPDRIVHKLVLMHFYYYLRFLYSMAALSFPYDLKRVHDGHCTGVVPVKEGKVKQNVKVRVEQVGNSFATATLVV